MIKIGIICPSEIAFRRFMPALSKCDGFQYVGIAIASRDEWVGHGDDEGDTNYETIHESEFKKALSFQKQYGGEIFESYQEMLQSKDIDAVYFPLPPALHFKWVQRALKNQKHALVEKPSTMKLEDTRKLIDLAAQNKLALHENYMFTFHNQVSEIEDIVVSGKLGDVRLYRLDFGFPRRAKNDFRYSKELGGGALLDCGGYTLKYATMLLGKTVKIDSAILNYTDDFNVDLYGSATLVNDSNQVMQVAFGMDNAYKCDLEIWGSRGRLIVERVLTAPTGFSPEYQLIDENGKSNHSFQPDDTFTKSIKYFEACINESQTRKESYQKIYKQAELVSDFMNKAATSVKCTA